MQPKILSQKDYLYDAKIRSDFALKQAITDIRIKLPNSKFGLVFMDFNGADFLEADDCVWLSLCRSKCDLLIVGAHYSQYEFGPNSEKYGYEKVNFLLASLGVVDYVFTTSNMYEDTVKEINPHFWFEQSKSLCENIRIGQTLKQHIMWPPWEHQIQISL